MEYEPTSTAPPSVCCVCASLMEPNASNMCVSCLRSRVDITQDLPKQLVVQQCKKCERWHAPPDQWIFAPLESKELLAFCLRRVRGLNRNGLKLIDAAFVWTEEHSKRLQVKLVVQKEVLNGAILEQSFLIEYVVQWSMCGDCHRQAADITWSSVAQVRQRVPHKRTFYWLEQVILKAQAHHDTLSLQERGDGLDFYFGNRSRCIRFIEFLCTHVPARYAEHKKLISYDEQNSAATYKHSFSVEIAPVCKDDLICLPDKVAARHGGMSPLVLCTRVTAALQLIDPFTLAGADVLGVNYWKEPFGALVSSRQLIEYVVMDASLSGETRGRFALADVEVARARDLGRNTTTFLTRTHLGHVLNIGDTVLGYDLSTLSVNHDGFAALAARRALPDCVLVRKTYPRRRARVAGTRRLWQLQRLPAEVPDDEDMTTRRSEAEAARRENDFEQFLRELEEDPEARRDVNIYKNPLVMKELLDALPSDTVAQVTAAANAADEAQRLRAAQFLSRKARALRAQAAAAAASSAAATTTTAAGDDDDEEEDFPEVLLTEMQDLSIHEEPPHAE